MDSLPAEVDQFQQRLTKIVCAVPLRVLLMSAPSDPHGGKGPERRGDTDSEIYIRDEVADRRSLPRGDCDEAMRMVSSARSASGQEAEAGTTLGVFS